MIRETLLRDSSRFFVLLIVLVVGQIRTDAAVVDRVPPEEFLVGFNQVGSGTGPSLWPLTDAQLTILTEEIGVNAIRIFVHPFTVGFPQQSWVGPEAVVYHDFNNWVWDRPEDATINSLDEIIRKLIEFDIYPILLPLTVDTYQSFMYKNDLTFLNAQHGVDYTGINPLREFRSYALAVAGHVQQTFDIPFGIVFTEVCAQNRDNAAERGGEKEAWDDVATVIRAVAPKAEIFGPEVCIGMAWWSTVSRDRCDLDPVYYSNDFPFHDYIENYAEVFDSLTISFYGITQTDLNLQMVHCPSTRVRATAGVGLLISRDNALPKRWTYGEVGWGSKDGLDTIPGVNDRVDEVHFAWASTLFGLDHSRGLLVWQAKGNEGSRAGIWNQGGSVNADALEAWRVMGPMMNENAEFLSTYHSQMNADNFPTDDNTLFVENETAVLTRKLANHVIIYSEGPTAFSFSGVDSLNLDPVYSGGTAASVSKIADRIQIGNLTPSRLYIMEILSGPTLTPFRRGDFDISGDVDFTDAIAHLEFLFLGLGEIDCEDAADSNDDGLADFSDAIHTLTVLFLGGTIPPPGKNSCGVDPTADALDCGSYSVACP